MTCEWCGTNNDWGHGEVLGFDLPVGEDVVPAGTRMCFICLSVDGDFKRYHYAVKPFWPEQVLTLEGPIYFEGAR